MTPSDLPDRIAKFIVTEIDSDCWRWIGASVPRGYGRATWMGRVVYAHRLTYRLLVDSSLELFPGKGTNQPLDHVADRCNIGPSCVNPTHLEPVTSRLNAQRQAPSRSGYIGVRIGGRSFTARIRHLGEHVSLGSRATARDAAMRYDAACAAIGATPANFAAGRLPEPSAALVDEMRLLFNRSDVEKLAAEMAA